MLIVLYIIQMGKGTYFMKTILFQGDSITDGNRYKLPEQAWDLNHQMGHGYSSIVNGQLEVKYPEKDLKFINKGISGNRLVDLFARMQADILNLSPDLLSILVGINDAYEGVSSNSVTAPNKFDTIYHMLLDEVIERYPDIKLVLCEPFFLPIGKVEVQRKEWEAAISPLQDVTRKVAEEYKAIFIPYQQIFNELCTTREPSYWIWDGIHPTVCGHQVIADQWIKQTKDIFEAY
jgi:lysophospholipase L1-like esterase